MLHWTKIDRQITAGALDAGVIQLHGGIDQADRSELARIYAEGFGDTEIDLVIDDCSHGDRDVSLEVFEIRDLSTWLDHDLVEDTATSRRPISSIRTARTRTRRRCRRTRIASGAIEASLEQ